MNNLRLFLRVDTLSFHSAIADRIYIPSFHLHRLLNSIADCFLPAQKQLKENKR